MNYVRDAFDKLCTVCQAKGDNPRFVLDKCTKCERTLDEVRATHGVVQLDVAMKCVVFARRAQTELKYSKGEMVTLLVEGMIDK